MTVVGPKQESTVRQVPEDQRTVARAMGTGKAGKLARHDEPMGIVVDGECISSPIVREPLCSQESFCISASDMTEARVLAHRLRTGTKTGPRPI
jgi:preprotein translocase subunit SecD